MDNSTKLLIGIATSLGILWVFKGMTPGGAQVAPPDGSDQGLTATEKQIMKYSPVSGPAGLSASVDPALISAVIERESAGKADARGAVGEVGLMQIRPETANLYCQVSEAQLWNIPTNITCGAKYLGTMIRMLGSVPAGVAAYNAGPGNVRADLAASIFRVPTTTQKYAQSILIRAQYYRSVWERGYMPNYLMLFPASVWDYSGGHVLKTSSFR